uniref:SFRICE_001015 n=1 Tax=Spodoptera frugiperda TaxID=7108 RepID=A0A2H1UZY4_SPOFR
MTCLLSLAKAAKELKFSENNPKGNFENKPVNDQTDHLMLGKSGRIIFYRDEALNYLMFFNIIQTTLVIKAAIDKEDHCAVAIKVCNIATVSRLLQVLDISVLKWIKCFLQ